MAVIEQPRAVVGTRARPRRQRPVGTVVLYLVLIALGITFVAPLVWVVTASLESGGGLSQIEIPNPPRWQNYADVLTILPLPTFFFNSVIITVASVVGTVVSSSLVAFSLARLRWPGRNLMFTLVIITMMLPGIVTLVPGFLIFRYLGWLDTFLPLIVPTWTGGAFYVFFSHALILHEHTARTGSSSAYLNGMPVTFRSTGASFCRSLSRYWQPWQSLPFICVERLHCYRRFISSSMEHYTLPLGLFMYQGRYGNSWNLVMAAAMYFCHRSHADHFLPCPALFH